MFLKHPLFWKEWKVAKWWSLLIGSMFLVMFLAISNALNQVHEMTLGKDGILWTYSFRANQGGPVIQPIFLRAFDHNFAAVAVLLLPVIIIMSMMFFQSDRQESVGMFVSSLPFTKKEQFRIKWFAGVLAFTIPFLLATLFAIFMRQVNIGWISQWYGQVGYSDMLAYDSVWLVLSMLAQSYLFMVTFFSVLMLMQSLIGQSIAASIIGSFVVAAPWFILEAGGATLSRLFNNYQLRLYNIRWGSLYSLMEPNSDISIHEIRLEKIQGTELGYHIINMDPMISMDHYIIKIVILIVIAALAFYVGTKFYEKNDNSRNGYILMFPWVGKILVPGVSICSGLLGNNLIRLFIRIESVSFEIGTLMVSGLIGYLVITKMIGLTEKHGA